METIALDEPSRAGNYFILVTVDSHPSAKIGMPAFQVALHRLQRLEWGLATRTRYRKLISKGDSVLIYISGKRSRRQCLVAAAIVNSHVARVPPKDRSKIDIPTGAAANRDTSQYKLALAEVQLFREPIPFKSVVGDMQFLKQERRDVWQIYFQGGIVRITGDDYTTIMQRAGLEKGL
jgi:hypothetical protein